MNQSSTTPDRLMAAGRKLFAEKGFDGTSLREITADAQANLGAVTYHFKTKEALYHAILEDVLGDLSSRIEAAARGHGTPPERLRGIVQATFGFFTAAPDAPQLVVRELAHGTPPAPFARMARRNLAAVTQVVRDGQKHAVFRDIEPILVAFSLISQSVWFALAGRQIVMLVGLPIDPATFSAMVERHIADVVLRSLATGKESR